MPKVTIYKMDGSKAGEMALNDEIFGIEPNQAVLHQVIVAQLANKRQGTQSALTRAEVSGGGIKPWRQKGTGRARQGSTRSPQWRHGGVVFAPKPRSYRQDINKMLDALKISGKAMIVTDAPSQNVELSARNIPGVKTGLCGTLNVLDILNYDSFIISKAAVEKVQEVYA